MVRTRLPLLLSTLLFSLLITGCPGGGGGGSSSDSTPPTVSSTQPAADATDIASDTILTATFSEAMDSATLTAATFTLTGGGHAVGGTVSSSGATATFTPSAPLTANTIFTATLTTGTKDLAGNPLAADFSWSFTTAPDTTPPTVLSTTPATDAVDVPLNSVITVVFSEPMDSSTLNSTTISLRGAGGPVDGTVGFSSNSATFTPAANLNNSTVYTARVSTGVTDLAGNPLAAEYTWQFTSGGALDNIPPTVTSVTPANKSTNVPLSTTISATFSEAMDPSTIKTDSFVVGSGSTFLAGSVAYSGTTATFTPSAPLPDGADITATIKTFVKDLAGNAMATEYTWHFTSIKKPTICVIPGGGGPNSCYAKINDAIAVAGPTDLIGVAVGTYTENVLFIKTVSIQGGWTLAIDAQDPVANVTTIQPADPSLAVVTITGNFADTTAVAPIIDGFTITGALSGNHGGGIRMIDSDATVRNSIITGNQGFLYGGGIFVQRGAPSILNNQITNNTVTPGGPPTYGGGIKLENTSASLTGNIITGNQSTDTTGYGGGIAIQDGTLVRLTGNTISGNTASLGSGFGGGVSLENATATLSGNTIQDNIAGANASRSNGGGVYIINSTSFTLNTNTINGNILGGETTGFPPSYGGGVYMEASQGSFTDNIVSTNQAAVAGPGSATGWGGGVAIVNGSTVFFHNDKLTGNSVKTGQGCGLYADASSIRLNAASIQDNGCFGLYLETTSYTLDNSLVTGNTSGGLQAVTTSPGLLVNNTFSGTNSGEGINTDSALTFVNNIIMNFSTGVTAVAPITLSNDYFNDTTPRVGFAADPTDLAVDPDLKIDFHLNSGSPVIDAGVHDVLLPENDLDGQSRAMIGSSGLFKVDIGADEFSTPRAQRIVNLDGGGALTVVGPGGQDANATNNDWIGYAVLGGDFNGDGKSDLIVSAEDWVIDFNNPPHSTGRLFGILNLGTRQLGTIDLSVSPDLVVDSEMNLQHLGSALTGGDLNGDGKTDLIAGSYQDDGGGGGAVFPTVFAFWGGSSLIGTRLLDGVLPSDNHADFALQAPGQDFFAFSAKNALATADLNGDGKADLMVGDGLADDGATAAAGAVFVIFGGSGLTGLHDLGTTPADFTLYGPAAAAGLQSLAAGKLDGDTNPDLVARTADTAYVILGAISAGSRHLGITAADVTISGLTAGGVAVMDLNGDGQDDLILGSGDKIYIIPGPLTAGPSFDISTAAGLITLTGSAADAVFGVGNVVGDSKDDLIIGMPSIKRVFVIFGGMSLSGTIALADASATLVESALLNKLGYDVSAGDFDNDTRPDLIVSTWQQNLPPDPPPPAGFEDAGFVYVIYGK